MNRKWVIKCRGIYLMGVRLAPVPYEYWGDDRSNAMEWSSLTAALRALRALKLDAFGAGVTTE